MTRTLTYAEAHSLAIAAGALKPQGLTENMAAGVMSYNGGSWASTPKAQDRLERWTDAIFEGMDPRSVKSLG